MTYRNSSWTGRAPRTMADAFGPYVTSRIYQEPWHRRILRRLWGWC